MRTVGVIAGLFVLAGLLSGCVTTDAQCVRVPDTKKVTKTVYDEKCKTICKSPGPCEAITACFTGGCADCGKPREIHQLVKKTETKECQTTKCEPVPACNCPVPSAATATGTPGVYLLTPTAAAPPPTQLPPIAIEAKPATETK
jgi:hypothetical protein